MTVRGSQDHVRRTRARALAIGGGLWLLVAGPGCSVLPIPDKPRISLTPTYGYLALSGKGRMDTRLGGGGRQQNPYLDLGRSLNVTDRDTAIGGDLAYGDGFQGAEKISRLL